GADLLDKAERLHRRVAGAGGPADHLALAAYLGRRGRAEEAVQVCQKATAADALAVAEVLVGIGYGPADLTPTDLDRIGGELTRALDRTKVPGPAGMMRGVWAARRGDYRAAADAFRAAAEAGGGPAALNNLAYMLVLSGSPAGEAETVLQKVVDQVGLSPEVLDTRGALRLGAGRVAEAVADLEQAVDQEPTAARLVHLAAAYEKAGRKDDAKRALARADGLKGDGSLVLPAERAEYLRLSDASRKSP
ncbi:MAG: tetratricopeptide repeat protein, partial [Gemmataceae bacterium]|nr:tetratricopeptide repeat protein [Gemmataceae bacterium]